MVFVYRVFGFLKMFTNYMRSYISRVRLLQLDLPPEQFSLYIILVYITHIYICWCIRIYNVDAFVVVCFLLFVLICEV
jgi:hypothetical protein